MNRNNILFFKENKFFANPMFLQIEITNRCPLKCSQCYKPMNGGSDIDFDLVRDIFEDAHACGVKYIMLNGGEPLIYPHFIELLRLSYVYRFEVMCVTSGISITDNLINEIKNTECQLQLSVSLNGSTKKIHEESRDGYDIAIEAMRRMKALKMPYEINWVSRVDNVKDFPNLVQLAKEYGANSINVITTKLDGQGVLQSKLHKEDYLFLKKYIDSQTDNYIKIQHCFPYLNGIVKHFNNSRRNRCPAGITAMCIDVNGCYRPCIHLYNCEPISEYNSMRDYWINSNIMKRIRNAKNVSDNCSDCLIKDTCKTCFCMNKYNEDNLTIGDDLCPIKDIINA